MKLLYYSPHPQLRLDAPTGYGTHMREMIAAWRRMGVEVKTLIAGDEVSGEYGESNQSRFSRWKKHVPSIFWETAKDINLLRYDGVLKSDLEKAITEFKPDLIYERVAYLQNSGIKMATKRHIRHISEINAPFPEERIRFSGKSWLLKQARDYERQILAHSDLITTVSSALKSHLAEKLSDIEEKIMVVPNCVNPDEVSHEREDIEEIRSAYELDGKTVIGFVGSIFPYHGVDILIKAFSALDRGDQLRLLIVGDGETLSELKSDARRLGVLDRCIFTGSIPHRYVYAMIEAMDICCMPKSNWYGSPVKIFEYGLMKKPVIAPDVAPVKDVMRNQIDGILISPEVDELILALRRLLKNRDFRSKVATSWHEKVLLEYTWDNAAKRILEACT